MNKICTSVEQSKKLIELGIDVDTADMIYTTFYGAVSKSLPMPKEVYEYFKYPIDGDKCVPAWSLAALSEFILPYIADNDGNNYKFYLSKDGLDRWVAYYKSDDVSIHICEESDNMIDVILEMVCWLKEK